MYKLKIHSTVFLILSFYNITINLFLVNLILSFYSSFSAFLTAFIALT